MRKIKIKKSARWIGGIARTVVTDEILDLVTKKKPTIFNCDI